MKRRLAAPFALMLLLVSLAAGCGGKQATPTPVTGPQRFPRLKVAIVGEPPSLDMHTTTATLTFEMGWHIFETLYTYTAD